MKTPLLLRVALWSVAIVGIVIWILSLVGVLPAGPGKATSSATSSVVTIGGPFRLVSHRGESVSEATFKRKATAVFFGFTHCPDVCPTTLFGLTSLMQALGRDADRLFPLFITVDPERDTQPVLAQYMESFDPRITALTGSRAEVDSAVQAFRATYRKVDNPSGGYTMDHTAVVYLMDRDGKFFGTLDQHEPRDVQIAKLRRLLSEGKGA